MSVRVDQGLCFNCGKKLTAISVPEGDVPLPGDGDLAICLYCSHIHVFDDGKLRNPTDAEIIDIAGDPDMLKVMKFNQRYREMFPKEA